MKPEASSVALPVRSEYLCAIRSRATPPSSRVRVALLLLCVSAALGSFTSSGALAQSFPFSVPVTAELYSVDRPLVGDCIGTLTVVISLPPGLGRSITFANISGTSSAGAAWPTVDADGGPNVCGPGNATDLGSLNGLSSIRHITRCNFLAGAFVVGTPQIGTQPAGLTFVNDTTILLNPELQQIFYIGNGVTTDNQTQIFAVPNNATRIVLGVPDGGCFRGTPGAYCDNTGTFAGTLIVTPCLATPTGPSSVEACFGTEVSLSITASGIGPFTYQWRKGTTPINIQANPTAATNTLTFASVQEFDAGVYDCVVTNACGSIPSTSATLTVLSESSSECVVCADCAADFDQDGGVTGGDIELFFLQFDNGQPCSDVNRDGSITGDDIALFLREYEAGGC